MHGRIVPQRKPPNMSRAFTDHLAAELAALRDAGLSKTERVLTTPQGALVKTTDGLEVINLCANNYLGLSSHPQVIAAAHEALRTHGFGMSSVRFICGTQDLHKRLEARLANFLGTEDAILYAAAFDANGGLFEPLLGEDDAVISDELNHASIIDGIRLCKARRCATSTTTWPTSNAVWPRPRRARKSSSCGASVRVPTCSPTR